MTGDGPLSELDGLTNARAAIDRRERQLVIDARQVFDYASWRDRREAAGLRRGRNPINCRNRSCRCNRTTEQHLFTWTELGTALGISRAAVQKRHPDID